MHITHHFISTHVYIYNYILQCYINVGYVSTIYLLLYIFDFYTFYCKYYFLLYLINMHIYLISNILFTFLYLIDIFNTFKKM